MWNILQLTIILSSLIYNVQSFIDNLNLKYETLSKNKEGRHFLVTTLLEKLYQPLNEPRFQGRVVLVRCYCPMCNKPAPSGGNHCIACHESEESADLICVPV